MTVYYTKINATYITLRAPHNVTLQYVVTRGCITLQTASNFVRIRFVMRVETTT